MDFPLGSTTTTAALFAFLLFLICYYLLGKKNTGQNITAPVAAGAWPIIGHLHLLGGPQLPHKVLGSMAEKYGPIFTIKFGVHQTLIVSDLKMAKECFTTNDRIFATRPKSIAVELMGYNYGMFGLAPYGPYWREVRKLAILEFLSNRRIEMLRHIRASEVKASIKDVYELWLKNRSPSASNDHPVKMEMKQWFAELILNMVVMMMAGKRYSKDDEESGRSQKALRAFLELLGAFVLSDAVPYLRWLDLGGHEKVMKKVGREIDDVAQGWLQEHKVKRNCSQLKGEQKDFIDVLLSIQDGASPEDLPGFDADTTIKATCMALLSAATDTTTVTLTWALSLLLNNRHVLRKALDELDIHVGRERQVEDSDIKNLVYIQAIIKETLRLYPPAPLSLPHESMEDCIVGGYHVPKGTRLLTNVWKIHHDPRVWSDPFEFRPERFLTTHKDVDVRGQHFELIPFGSGRRMCPGISLALQVVELTLASLLHGFEITTPSDEPIDLSESFGLTNLKATPIEVLLTPRLPSNLYQ